MICISIHAPCVRGDCADGARKCSHPYFNSHLCERGDTRPVNLCTTRMPFQFTPLREGRRAGMVSCCWQKCFNSRPYVRDDRSCLRAGQAVQHFNSRPLREGRPVSILGLKQMNNFSSRTCVGATTEPAVPCELYPISIHVSNFIRMPRFSTRCVWTRSCSARPLAVSRLSDQRRSFSRSAAQRGQ